MCNVATFYKRGTGAPKDECAAVEWYRRAAEAGHTGAQLSLGFCYEDGKGVTADACAAVVWYRRAADAGDANAQCQLSVCYLVGTGVPVDMRAATEWIDRASASGGANAALVENNRAALFSQAVSRAINRDPPGR